MIAIFLGTQSPWTTQLLKVFSCYLHIPFTTASYRFTFLVLISAGWAVNKTQIGLLGSDRIVDRIGLRIGSDRIGLTIRLKFPPKWSRDIPRNEDGGEKSMYTIFCN